MIQKCVGLLAMILLISFNSHSNTFIFYDEYGKAGFLHINPWFFQPPIYDNIYDDYCVDDKAPLLVEINQHYYYVIRTNGEKAFEIESNYLSEFSEFVNGYALIIHAEWEIYPFAGWDKDTFLIDNSGNKINMPPDIIPCSSVHENKCQITSLKRENMLKYGFYDLTTQSIIIDPMFDFAGDFFNGYAAVCQNDLWGHIDEFGNLICPPQFDLYDWVETRGYTFGTDGTAVILLSTGEKIRIDIYGNTVSDAP